MDSFAAASTNWDTMGQPTAGYIICRRPRAHACMHARTRARTCRSTRTRTGELMLTNNRYLHWDTLAEDALGGHDDNDSQHDMANPNVRWRARATSRLKGGGVGDDGLVDVMKAALAQEGRSDASAAFPQLLQVPVGGGKATADMQFDWKGFNAQQLTLEKRAQVATAHCTDSSSLSDSCLDQTATCSCTLCVFIHARMRAHTHILGFLARLMP